MGMAMDKAITVCFLILAIATSSASAVDHTVGDSRGWTLGPDYSTWASGKTFQVGDVLVFNYGSTHRVDVVGKSDYDSCATTNVISAHDDGNTRINLTSPGDMYFICSTPGHCSGGMKLAVSVSAASSGGSTPSSPPSGSGTPDVGSPPTTADNNGAVSSLCSMFVSLVIAGIVFAFMS